MMRVAGLIVAACLLSGCLNATGVQKSAEEIARDQAKTVVNDVVESRLPGVNVSAATDCIIDNASLSEVFSIAKASVTGPDEATVSTILDIAKRPDTAKCLVSATLALL
ncbi:succinate dehydrogenase [Shimia ponticola]|uniref:succinate dehydrogenase n=1 Tax=Shimia ponticola TaxID=2582893 RepID=UPI0011BDBAA3|nr:succinate dehydrogenase [Shimia ponticola]